MNQPTIIVEKSASDKGTLVDHVIGRIEQDLRAGRFAPGTLMGTQSDLCAAYGVSPPVFFQASRVLMHRGLVELRKGNGGGLFAADNSVTHVGKRMATYLECIGVDFADAAPVSRLLQELCVRLATETMTLESIAAIRAITQQLTNQPDHFDRGRLLSKMFQQFAEASGNAVLALLYRVITDVMLDVTAGDSSHADREVPPAVVLDLGLQIANAVIAADHEHAASAYLQFRDALIRWQMALPQLVQSGTAPASFADRDAESGKLPERLAVHILREIRQMHWPVGARLGNEPDLLERYGVSRATFRQAIRLLEEYSAVETKRGPKGGLLIASPSATVINETALTFLQVRNATTAMSRALLAPLMTLALDMALASGAQHRAAIAGACEISNDNSPIQLGKLTDTVLRQGEVKVLDLFVRLLANFEIDCADATSTVIDPTRFSTLLAALQQAARANDRLQARGAMAELTRRFGTGLLPAPARGIVTSE